jgi:hypothetical protein
MMSKCPTRVLGARVWRCETETQGSAGLWGLFDGREDPLQQILGADKFNLRLADAVGA